MLVHGAWWVGCGQVIDLRVTSLDVEPDEGVYNDDDDDADDDDGSCSYDCLQLFDGEDVHSEPLSARLCGHVAPSTTFQTSSNAACVHFRSDYFTAGTGFQLDYHVVVPQHEPQAQRRIGHVAALLIDYPLKCAFSLITMYSLE